MYHEEMEVWMEEAREEDAKVKVKEITTLPFKLF